MKTVKSALFSLIFLSFSFYGQEISGKWNGVLKVQGMQLRLVFDIAKNENGYNATMDSPDQGAKGIVASAVSFENFNFKLEISNLNIQYTGILDKDNTIVGNFMQGGQSFPMNLSQTEVEKQVVVRPQEPAKPYPYYSEDITFDNKKDTVTLSGTLTLPSKEGKFPAVILISGSGPQNRNEEMLDHKPFLVLADYLTKNGIAVLRYDDRGTAKSSGYFKNATTLDFASDVEAALNYLKTRTEINSSKIGLIGHSEGGIIAPMVASKSKYVNYIILLAGTGISGDQLLILQQESLGKASGVNAEDLMKSTKFNRGAFDIILKSTNTEILKSDLTNYINQNGKTVKPTQLSDEEFLNLEISQLTNPWMVYFLKHNPADALQKITCPVLALNGEKDLQVPSQVNLEAIKKALEKGGNKKVSTKIFPKLNHLFQECKTGLPSEYSEIEQTLAPIVLNEISNWILEQTK
jgi:uncharacterized protein